MAKPLDLNGPFRVRIGEVERQSEVKPTETKPALEGSKESRSRGLASRAPDPNAVKEHSRLVQIVRGAFDTMANGALVVSNFLRKFGSDEESPKLYAPFSMEPPTDRPLDEAAIEANGERFRALGDELAKLAGGPLPKDADLQLLRRQISSLSNLGLATDALKVKMAAWNLLTPELRDGSAIFEMGIRNLPKDRDTNFWVVGGVNACLEWLATISNGSMRPEAVEWMRSHELFKHYPKDVFDGYFMPPRDASGDRVPGSLSEFEKDIRSLTIDAVPDGEIYVGGPLMRVSGPPAVVEFIETNLMRLMTGWTSVATSAAQMTLAGQRPAADFSPRRTPGGGITSNEISMAAALGGMTVTSNLLLGYVEKDEQTPITGTMEHSQVLMQKAVIAARKEPWTKAETEMARSALDKTLRAGRPELSDAQLKEALDAQLNDVLLESRIFKNLAFEYDREKAVALIDTKSPEVGLAAAIVAQQQIWAEKGKDVTLNALRLDSGDLLSQALQFRRVMNEVGMSQTKILATDGLAPANLELFGKVEAAVMRAKDGKLPADFADAVKGAKNPAQATKMAELLVKSPSFDPAQRLFAGYGAGQRIGDSVETVGNPEFIYKAAEISFRAPDGSLVTQSLAKTASPEKATGPARELFQVFDQDGKISHWIVGTPDEASKASGRVQKQMRRIYEDGQIKVDTSHKKAVEHAATLRALLPESLLKGERPKLGMTQAYFDKFLGIVAANSDEETVQRFDAYFKDHFPRIEVAS